MMKKKEEARTQKYTGRFVDIRTDFGFKWYFGREENKSLLIAFLNSLFEGERVIRDLQYMPVEQDGEEEGARRVIFDLYCIGLDGEHFIVEMQQSAQGYFKDRIVYYSSRLIGKQLTRGKKGNNYRLPPVYFIGILDFRLDSEEEAVISADAAPQYFYDIALLDQHTHQVFYDKLGYKLLVLPDFQKTEEKLDTLMDQWVLLIKYLHTWDKFPKYLDKRVFGLIFDIGEIGKLTEEERMSYETSLKHKWDAENVLDYALSRGRKEGLQEGLQKGLAQARVEAKADKLKSARNFKKMGIPSEDIAKGLELSIEEVEKLE